MMRVYQIFIPELNAYVKFKVLPPEEITNFLGDLGPLEDGEFCKIVLERLVFNMKTELRESLKMMSNEAAKATITAIYNGCVMLNPGIDLDLWVDMAYAKPLATNADSPTEVVGNSEEMVTAVEVPAAAKKKKISNAKFNSLRPALQERIVGQPEAIDTVCKALMRSQAGLSDANRPLGVFLFAGPSGVGKTSLAKELQKHLYGAGEIVRVNCGEYQHKHDNQKLIGSPPGYIGHDEGGQLTNGILANPNTVVLLDEVEKAHIDIWNTFLNIFDEGMTTDSMGRQVDFRNAIIIMTTNLGNDKIVSDMTRRGTGFGSRIEHVLTTKEMPSRTLVERTTQEEIRKLFKPEFLNRVDSAVVFNHLAPEDFAAIADLEMRSVDEKLSKKGISFSWDEKVLEALIDKGVDTVMGARGMEKVRRDEIETLLAGAILDLKGVRGTVFDLTFGEEFNLNVRKPVKQGKAKTT
jgi:ATP-dependent Clp protease ATP-binding subunit ClpC